MLWGWGPGIWREAPAFAFIYCNPRMIVQIIWRLRWVSNPPGSPAPELWVAGARAICHGERSKSMGLGQLPVLFMETRQSAFSLNSLHQPASTLSSRGRDPGMLLLFPLWQPSSVLPPSPGHPSSLQGPLLHLLLCRELLAKAHPASHLLPAFNYSRLPVTLVSLICTM